MNRMPIQRGIKKIFIKFVFSIQDLPDSNCCHCNI